MSSQLLLSWQNLLCKIDVDYKWRTTIATYRSKILQKSDLPINPGIYPFPIDLEYCNKDADELNYVTIPTTPSCCARLRCDLTHQHCPILASRHMNLN